MGWLEPVNCERRFALLLRILASIGVVLMTASSLIADMVTLQNGDRISGRIIALEEGTLQFETQYAGVISLAWPHVATFETDQSISLLLENGDRITGAVQAHDQLSVLIESNILGVVEIETATIAGLSRDPQALMSQPARAAQETIASLSEEVATQQEEMTALQTQLEEATDVGQLWNGSVSFLAGARTGNREAYDAFIRAEGIRETENEQYTVLGEFGYGKVEDSLQTQEALLQNTLRIFFWDDTYLFGDLALEHDLFEDIDLRSELTAGGGYRFWETDTAVLLADLGAGLSWEFYHAGGDELQPSLRVGVDYRQQIFEASELSQKLTVYPRLGKFGELRLVSKTSFSTPLLESLAWTLDLMNEYVTNPREEAESSHDLSLRSGLQYSF